MTFKVKHVKSHFRYKTRRPRLGLPRSAPLNFLLKSWMAQYTETFTYFSFHQILYCHTNSTTKKSGTLVFSIVYLVKILL